jgi:Outer membrane protein beta-barrel domain
MKKIILLLPVACIAVFASAQVRFGVKAGYNLSTLIYSGTVTLDGEKSKSGFNAGLYASIPFSESFSLQPEFVYSQQGANFQNNTEEGTLNYDYLNIPVLIKYKLPVGLFFETGLQVGILLTANEKSNGNSTDIMYKTYSPDYAWPLGLGFEMPNKHFGIDLRYNLGLINILRSGSDVNVKNSVFQFGVFYTF